MALPLRLASLLLRIPNELRLNQTHRSLGLSWQREGRRDRAEASAGPSGGWLGRDEHLVRSSGQSARLERDLPVGGYTAWAVRSYVAGSGGGSPASGGSAAFAPASSIGEVVEGGAGLWYCDAPAPEPLVNHPRSLRGPAGGVHEEGRAI